MIKELSYFYKKIFNYTVYSADVAVSVEKKRKLFLAKVGKKFVSLPHFSYAFFSDKSSGSITNTNVNFSIDESIIVCSDPSVKWEIRSFKRLSQYYNNEKVVSYLKLEKSEEKQWMYFSSSLRNNVKKAIKKGITVQSGRFDLLDNFYYVYSKNMHMLGSPVYSKKFFKELLKSFHNDTQVFVAYIDGKPIGCSFYLKYNEYSEICWASSIRKYNNLNTNYLVYWESIKYALSQNCDYFSFGRSTKNAPTYKFKHHWSPIEKTLYFNYSHPQERDLKKQKYLSVIWKKIPYRVTLLIGPKILKYIY
jgi:serine/alanine adding enzyme